MITASILSKKLSEGLNALVMDVKVGSGAFMPTFEKSLELAESIVNVGNGAGMKTVALMTDMNQSLAPCAGNAIEVRCAIEYLTGKKRPARLHEVTMALAARLLLAAGLAPNEAEARAKLQQALDSGCAAERFARMVCGLGGPADLLTAPDRHLASAPVGLPVEAVAGGYVHSIDCRRLGLTIVGLGGGRQRPEDDIDHAVGLTDLAELGQQVEAGQPIALVHAHSREAAQHAAASVLATYKIGDERPTLPPCVYREIQA
jgi:thymidine phosphorylase